MEFVNVMEIGRSHQNMRFGILSDHCGLMDLVSRWATWKSPLLSFFLIYHYFSFSFFLLTSKFNNQIFTKFTWHTWEGKIELATSARFHVFSIYKLVSLSVSLYIHIRIRVVPFFNLLNSRSLYELRLDWPESYTKLVTNLASKRELLILTGLLRSFRENVFRITVSE